MIEKTAIRVGVRSVGGREKEAETKLSVMEKSFGLVGSVLEFRDQDLQSPSAQRQR